MTITRPTLADLVELNKKGLRNLDWPLQKSKRDGTRFVDGSGRLIEARALPQVEEIFAAVSIPYPCFMPPSAFYEWGRFHLSKEELELVLGLDYSNGYNPNRDPTSSTELFAMWKANNFIVPSDANAYLLGPFYPSNGPPPETLVMVFYYHIDPRKHQELSLPKAEFQRQAPR